MSDGPSLIHELVGEAEVAEQMPGLHAISQCLRIVTRSRETVFLKFHKAARSFHQEYGFYKEFSGKWDTLPSLLYVWPEHRAMLLSSVPGRQVSAWRPMPQRTYFEAGGFLRKLHSWPLEDPDIPLPGALEKRLQAFEESAGTEARRAVTEPLRELLAVAPKLERSYCHRDFAEHNWLHDGKKLYVIDFEHSKPDFWLLDLVRLHSLTLCANEDAEEEFWEGYGSKPQEWEREFLARWSLLWAYQTKLWGARHGDSSTVAWARAALTHLGVGENFTE